uniref:Putative tick salivary peptide group 1 n=1 Tax=Ixodes ricinus TaxID=34613 RepID=V5H2C5_IXORI
MGLTGTTLVLVCLAFFGSAAAETCRNGTRPASETREKVATITAGTLKPVHGTNISLGTRNHVFYNSGLRGTCKNGECHVTDEPGVPQQLIE